MAITKILTIELSGISGAPMVGARCIISLSNPDAFSALGVVAPVDVEILTDSAGKATVSLIPNSLGTGASRYEISAYYNGSKILQKYFEMPINDTTLSELLGGEKTVEAKIAEVSVQINDINSIIFGDEGVPEEMPDFAEIFNDALNIG
jgi:hypothetical protein